MAARRIFAGRSLRTLRESRKLRQADMAGLLGLSASYLSQLENDERPLTTTISDRLRATFPIDWHDFAGDQGETLQQRLHDALSSVPNGGHFASAQVNRIAEQFPDFAEQFLRVSEANRRNVQRLEMLDEALGSSNVTGGRLPWEEVRDWFQVSNNYVDLLDRSAERLSVQLSRGRNSPDGAELASCLEDQGVTIRWDSGEGLRKFDSARNVLTLDQEQSPETSRFQLAYQLASMALRDEIAAVVGEAPLRTDTARRLLTLGLGNYAAGAIVMPYERFRSHAHGFRHDIDRLRHAFGTSFEQTCHRLSTLQRPQSRGTPMFFCRLDMAGNITKRHSATRMQFAQFGGTCPLWVVHEAVALTDRIHVQLAEMPDGVRYVSIAKGLAKSNRSYSRAPRRYAVALGCEAAFAGDFIYADSLNLANPDMVTPIGASCRICPRETCDQRAFPPNDREIAVDPLSRDLVPYQISRT